LTILQAPGETHAVAWELDGRSGDIELAGKSLRGFAVLRDRSRRLIAFHAAAAPRDLNLWARGTEQLVVPEDQFKPSPAS
jgi:hypothetical protein